MGRKKIYLKCENPDCNIQYYKDLSEFKRNITLNRKNYCSLHCSGKRNYLHILNKQSREKAKLNRAKIVIKKKEYSDFVYHLRKANTRSKKKNKEINIDKEYLYELWNKQNGRCVYTNIPLSHHSAFHKNDKIFTASLDRKDSSKGYIKGNIHFVSMIINYMKSDLTEIEAIGLIKIIRNTQ